MVLAGFLSDSIINMDEVILIKIQGRTLDNLPDEYTKEQYDQEYSKQEKLVAIEEFSLERNRRLTEVDWITLKAYSTQKVVPKAWRDYMQALRDLPANTEDPANPIWPTVPSS